MAHIASCTNPSGVSIHLSFLQRNFPSRNKDSPSTVTAVSIGANLEFFGFLTHFMMTQHLVMLMIQA